MLVIVCPVTFEPGSLRNQIKGHNRFSRIPKLKRGLKVNNTVIFWQYFYQGHHIAALF